MSKISYLCLDDDSASDSILNTIRSKELEIKSERPVSFDNQCRALFSALRTLDGLILDLRLDQNCGSGQSIVEYRASALAQHLRTEAAEKSVKSVPIVLWSTDRKLSESYYKDATGQDLFDWVYVKKDVPDAGALITAQLYSLAVGYKEITTLFKKNSLIKITKMPDYVSSALDPRIDSYFSHVGSGSSVHDYARALLKKLILKQGLLVSERELAALLGVNIDDSKDWPKLVTRLPKNSRYLGVFSGGWPRWWYPLIEKWWTSLAKDQFPLLRVEANDRIALIKRATGLRFLTAHPPIKTGYSTRYSCVCSALNRPLDSKDGFIVEEQNLAPWQSRSYVSAEGVLNRHKYKFKKEIDPLERPRLEALKQS